MIVVLRRKGVFDWRGSWTQQQLDAWLATFFNVGISCHFMSNPLKCLFRFWCECKVNVTREAERQTRLSVCLKSWSCVWPYLLTEWQRRVFFFPLSFSFYAQLSLGGIIVLQSQGRWGSRGPQHFSFRPGLSSAHCQHEDERTLMRHQGELPGRGWPPPKSISFSQNRVACFL